MKGREAWFRGFVAAVFLLTPGAGVLEVSADLLVHEPFEYPRRQGHIGADNPGEGVAGLNGGIGFSGSWTTEGFLHSGIPEGEGDFGDGETYGTSLGYRTHPLGYVDRIGHSLVTTGNQLRSSFGNNSSERRSLAMPIGEFGSTIWISFVAQAHGLSGSSRYAFVELSNEGQPWLRLGNVTPVSTGNWGYQVFSPSGTPHPSEDAGFEYPMDVPTMYLAKLEFPQSSEGFTQVSIWLNPVNLLDGAGLRAPRFQF